MESNLAVSRQILWKQALTLVLVAGLGLILNACGGKKSMEGAGDEEQVGKVEDNTTKLQGEEEGVAQASFDETEKARRLAALPKGSTKSGPGKLNSVTIKPGDTLWKIAERKDVYGSGWLYPLIYNANKALIKDPNKLEAGIKLKIPRNVSDVQEEIAKEDAMSGVILENGPKPGAQPTAVAATKAVKVKSSGAGSHWLLWLLLILIGALIFFWRRMKKQEAQPTAQA